MLNIILQSCRWRLDQKKTTLIDYPLTKVFRLTVKYFSDQPLKEILQKLSDKKIYGITEPPKMTLFYQ